MSEIAVKEVEHCWIPMPDGVRLSARIWRPEGAPCPAILEYIPYRKRDLVRARDARNHPYLAGHGYACLRVDMRGSGDSEGHMPDMYAEPELADARHVIDWIAAQPWCDGTVGMFGTSWGGTASLQATVDAPGPLKAVIANCATIDRFEDDIHWMGSCLLTDTLEWGATLPAILAAPPDAATVGDGWMAQWQARLEALANPVETWIRNTTREPYWRHGSVRFEADGLSVPILAIGGWADRYSNTVLPLVRARPDLVWGIVGPWGHHYPDQGEPRPGAHFQAIALDWFNHWLRPSTPLNWPRLRVWQRGFDPPQDRLASRSGGWILPEAEGSMQLYPGPEGLGLAPVEASFQVPEDIRHGECAGDTGYFGRVGGLPLDQRPDDARALSFDQTPLTEPLEIFGHPTLTLTAEGPGQVSLRLCDVAPDGRSSLITRTVQQVKAGTQHITFPSTAYRLAPGHRIRLALGHTYWPLVWPMGPAPRISGLRLELPLGSGPSTTLPKPATLPETPDWQVTGGPLNRYSTEGRMGWHQPPSEVSFPALGLAIETETRIDYSQDLRCDVLYRMRIRRPDGTAEIESRLSATAQGREITVETHLDAAWNGAPMAQKRHRFSAPIGTEP